ncbi:hydrolase 1, exosortase A system-associated [Pelomonas cellulosilytica]|uniref:Hydrolase 1, exosortase A system-associated n=1 Tax=Pelomonas cellulosilytica TaxID=2906762 RepID=A0ABS8Y004_9BURK|nr:hydrolase 1, exosortase A system-associated [Pelomonas sp. P8]MCE4557573.1 hydrolase 1, exosortase A system-associated [Pelomonas sp. P8]
MSASRESVLCIDCEGQRLVGILAEPEGAPADVGVLIVVGGPQYRAGSHRQFTLLARHLASQGFTALRFDYRSMGDSPGRVDEQRDFLAVQADIAAAIDALLAACPALRRVVLWGLCDAASAALLYVESTRDARVAGMALLNPWARSAATLAQTHVKHYYGRRLRQPEFWLKLLRGGVGLTALRTLAGNLRLARGAGRAADNRSFQERMAAGLQAHTGATLLILSGEDYTAQEFIDYTRQAPAWQGLLTAPRVQRLDLPDADHTFSTLAHQQAVEAATADWLSTLATQPHGDL